ncbi:hypothetical protein BD769DRAFT_1668789 [Suillus cothurnatus]|nr:hypothetical protein BD769DRAFT_1668789 [Suillus cothurnatus]
MSQEVTPDNVEGSVTSWTDVPRDTTTEEGPELLLQSNTERNSAHPPSPCECDIPVSLQQSDTSLPTPTNPHALKSLSIMNSMILTILTIKILMDSSIKILLIISIVITGILTSTVLMALLTLLTLSCSTLMSVLTSLVIALMILPILHKITIASIHMMYTIIAPATLMTTPPEHHDACNHTWTLSPVGESSINYTTEQECSHSLVYSNHVRYSSALDYGYMHEHGYPQCGDYSDRSHGFPPQHSGGYYNNLQADRREYNRDSRWANQDLCSPYHYDSPSSSSNTQLAEYPGNVPPSA